MNRPEQNYAFNQIQNMYNLNAMTTLVGVSKSALEYVQENGKATFKDSVTILVEGEV